MKKKANNIRFSAQLPTLLSQQTQYKKVTKKIWLTLSEDDRTKSGRWKGRIDYLQIIRLKPYENPYLERLLKKLNRQRVDFKTEKVFVNGVEFIRISAGEVAA